MSKRSRKIIIFLCVFALLAVAFTYGCIRMAEGEGLFSGSETGIDLYGTYDENDIEILSLTEKHGDIEVSIPQIKGLKDEAVQEKVNGNIKTRIKALVGEYPRLNYANYHIRSNFGNTISICFSISSEEELKQLYLNYELVTGKSLALTDLFKKDSDLVSVVRDAFYRELVLENSYNTPYNEAVSPDENLLYKLVNSYMNGEEQIFSFTPGEICFYFEDYVASVKMIDYAQDIVIYSKYMQKESIFAEDGIGFDNIFTCATSQYDTFDKIEYGYLEENLWYDITLWKSWFEEDFPKEKKQKYKLLEEEIYSRVAAEAEELRKTAKENPDRFYIFLAKPTLNIYYYTERKDSSYKRFETDLARLSVRTELFEMPVELHEERYRDEIIETYRYPYFAMRGGAYLNEPEDDRVIYAVDTKEAVYNYITGKEITSVGEVFKENFDYSSAIKEMAMENLSARYNYSREQAEKMAELFEYELTGTAVKVSIPEEDWATEVQFEDFDKEALAIFG